jgi:hypothetical protein
MDNSRMVERFELVIPCDVSGTEVVQSRIVERLEDLQFSPREVFRVRLSLEELLLRAIQQGAHEIRVTCQIDHARLAAEVDVSGA